MKILHLMLSNFYIDNANYQENIIPRYNKIDGHDVYIIASRDTFINNSSIGLAESGEYLNEDGIPVVRLDYLPIINDFFSMKFRAYKGLRQYLEKINPDVILFHGTCAWELNVVSKYIKRNKTTRLFVDSHEDFNNSANNFLSKHILHNLFYKKILQRNLKYIEKVLYITKETYNFLHDFYKVPEEKLAFFPLGGELPDPLKYKAIRLKRRAEVGASPQDILCIHSGKLDKLKRTQEILSAFSSVKRDDLKLIIIGKVEGDFVSVFENYVKNDKRIQYLGWKSGADLREYLMAGDLYIQLGGQSATMQQAVSNGNAVALYPFESHTYLLGDSSYYISNEEDLKKLLTDITSENIEEMKSRVSKVARDILDYQQISRAFLTATEM